MGPNGPLYDTRSPEWRMSGGDIFYYQQLMQQKYMMQQQKYMMQQMQKAAQLQKAQGKGKGKTNPNGFGQPGASNFNFPAGNGFYDPYAEPVNHYHRKTYKHGPSSKTTKSKSATTKKTP